MSREDNLKVINTIINKVANGMDLNKAIKGDKNNDSTLPMREKNRS